MHRNGLIMDETCLTLLALVLLLRRLLARLAQEVLLLMRVRIWRLLAVRAAEVDLFFRRRVARILSILAVRRLSKQALLLVGAAHDTESCFAVVLTPALLFQELLFVFGTWQMRHNRVAHRLCGRLTCVLHSIC